MQLYLPCHFYQCSTVQLNSPIVVEGVRVTFLVGGIAAELLPCVAAQQALLPLLLLD